MYLFSSLPVISIKNSVIQIALKFALLKDNDLFLLTLVPNLGSIYILNCSRNHTWTDPYLQTGQLKASHCFSRNSNNHFRYIYHCYAQ